MVEDPRERKPEKFIGYHRLVDACARPGCPVCRSLLDDSRRHLAAILSEQVTDPDTRRRLRASWGFCNWHAWMLLETENAFSGAAILYEDMVRTVMDRVRRLARRTRGRRFGSLLPWRERRPAQPLYWRREMCPVCESIADAERRYLETLLGFIGEPDLQAAYGRSDGLCVPHMLRAIELGDATGPLRELLDRTVQKWARLREHLEAFVRKHDYRNTEPYTEDEAASYRRAFEALSGAAGMFGNDLHVPIESMQRRRWVSDARTPGGRPRRPR